MQDKYFDVKDNAEATLSVGITQSSDEITVSSSVFDSLELPFVLYLFDADNTEIIKVFEKLSSTSFRVQRGFSGAARSWPEGTKAALTISAIHVSDLNAAELLRISGDFFIDTPVENEFGQITKIEIFFDNTKQNLLADTTFIYENSAARIPSSAVRRIFDSAGNVRRTETTTFTVNNHQITDMKREIS